MDAPITSMVPHMLLRGFIQINTPKSSRQCNSRKHFSLSSQKLVRVRHSDIQHLNKYGGTNVLGRRHLLDDLGVIRRLEFDAPYYDVDDEEGVDLTTPVRKRLLNRGAASRGKLHLGKGAFGNVIKATYKGDRVAAKVVKLTTDDSTSSKGQQSLLREYHAIGLQHCHVARIFFIERSPKYGLVVIERCTHTSLQQLLSMGFVKSYQEKIRVALEIAQAVNFCHSNGVLHLDVKPLNVLVDSNGSCKLTDFGNSVLDNCFGNFQSLGTLLYTAPEILMQKTPTPKADVYSLGITMWQIMSEETPYRQLKDIEAHVIIYQVVRKKERPHQVSPPTSSSNWAVFHGYTNLHDHCWMSKPEDRPCAEQVVSRLRELTNPKFRVDPTTFVID